MEILTEMERIIYVLVIPNNQGALWIERMPLNNALCLNLSLSPGLFEFS